MPSRLERYEGFGEAIASLSAGGDAAFDGAVGSSCALLAAELAQLAPAGLVLACSSDREAEGIVEDLALFASDAPLRFPAWESEPADQRRPDEVCGDRLRALQRLASAHPPPLVVTSIQSLMQPVPTPEELRSARRRLVRGEELDRDEFLRWLVERRFEHVTAVESPGEFSVRGGIVDLFSPDGQQPVRIEWFGDQVESIRRFDVATQRSVESLESVEAASWVSSGSEEAFLTDYLDPRRWFLLAEPEQMEEAGRRYYHRLSRPDRAHDLRSVTRRIGRFAAATAAALARSASGPACRLPIESVERFSGEVGRVRGELEAAGEGCQTHVVLRTEAEMERVREIFRTSRIAARGALHFVQGGLQRGFRLAPDRIVLISGDQLFHRAALRRAPRRRLGRPIDTYLDLHEGELVVHLAHGIGRYRGLKLLAKDSQVEEHVEIEFHGGVRLYVPAARIDLVQKYVGGSKSRPSLARIGGGTWVRQKEAAQAAVADLAAEMLDMQAARAARPGIAFGPDSEWQREFDASFPYPETPDQIAAAEAIKADMESQRPMDRLLCGDVGFGKTELAMRAAFKAVDSGYQVAVLVPTTILAEQHYQTFRERTAEFPFDIARLSRFCTAKEQREIVEGIASGRIDIVIGTHRLASRDVRFHNLGLVIIDEEQRFGVEVKERLKALRTEVDVMTMTATPIPRTLHMSLVGLRDISNLETPPEDRIAVETRVSRFDAGLIRRAILRELNRGGQIYFVHNRVQDIERIAARLRRIAPEAKIGAAHGQMPEAQLERIMVDFVAQRFDLLLATTIVENGLDIPTANTIFINEADRYGLADLHQLRGRVGRYKHRAYCYLLVEPRKHIHPNAARRLRAIEEFSDLGAGFALAMRDLEIRGAGNLLGAQQSGHIAAVGYELYCQLLENAVRSLKQQPPRITLDVDVDLPGEGHFPSDYIPDMRSKIDLYRRLARIEDFQQLERLREEMLDRFGPPPPAAERMLEWAGLRLHAAIWRIDAIYCEEAYVVFRYADRGRIEHLARLARGGLRVVDDRSAYFPLRSADASPDEILAVVKSLLQLS